MIESELIKNSEYMDGDWYVKEYKDVAMVDMSPEVHYLKYGAALGRNPSLKFNTSYYCEANSDVEKSGVNPLVHYIRFGRLEGRRARPKGLGPLFYPLKKSDFPKNPSSVSHLKKRLLNLGFVEKSLSDLAELARHGQTLLEKRMSAWELAVYNSNKNDSHAAIESLMWLDVFCNTGELNEIEKNRAAILKAENNLLLGKRDDARHIIEERLKISQDPDLYLALSNTLTGNEKIKVVNRVYETYDAEGVRFGSEEDLTYDNLSCTKPPLEPKNTGPEKVTIIIPAYNSEQTITTTLLSLASQTWQNIEVIVVDDCSTDGTVDVVKEFAMKDDRFKIISLDKNGGPYVARNTALKVATGDYITINDADDWSHPQKIEIQARHLNQNVNVIANMSPQARVTEDFVFYRRGNPGFYIQPNMSSLMFRREVVVSKVGYWDSVRFAADSEFTQRIKLHFGKEAIVNLDTAPMSFQRQTEGSLTGSSTFGYHGFKMGARRAYEQNHKRYHKRNKKAYIGFPQGEREFIAPAPMLPSFNNQDVIHYDVILASDFRFPGGTTMSNLEEIKAQSSMGLKTGLVQIGCYIMNPDREVNNKITEAVESKQADWVVFGEEVSCDVLVVRQPWVLEEKQQYMPKIKFKKLEVIVNQPPKRDYGVDSESIYHISNCVENLISYFGEVGTWYPIGPLVREALKKHHEQDLSLINLSDQDWPNIINVDEWVRDKLPPESNTIRICRHSRDQYVKWPDSKDDILAAYPSDKRYKVRVLGGAETPQSVLGYLPKNWEVYEFGAMSPKRFLSKNDVFVYYTHDEWVESFGRVIFEAMAVGLPVILPHHYKPLFKDAAIYAEIHEVRKAIDELMSSNEKYQSQVEKSLDFVRLNFGYQVHHQRLMSQ